MSATLVADPAATPTPNSKPEKTTISIFAEDGEDISELARLESSNSGTATTIAEVYAKYARDIIRSLRIAAAEKKLKELKSKKK